MTPVETNRMSPPVRRERCSLPPPTTDDILDLGSTRLWRVPFGVPPKPCTPSTHRSRLSHGHCPCPPGFGVRQSSAAFCPVCHAYPIPPTASRAQAAQAFYPAALNRKPSLAQAGISHPPLGNMPPKSSISHCKSLISHFSRYFPLAKSQRQNVAFHSPPHSLEANPPNSPSSNPRLCAFVRICALNSEKFSPTQS